MTPVGGPPRLAIGHQRFEIGLEGFEIQGFKGFAVIEAFADGVHFGIVLMEYIQVEGFGPPRHGAALAGLGVGTMHNGALTRSLIRLVHGSINLGWIENSVRIKRPNHWAQTYNENLHRPCVQWPGPKPARHQKWRQKVVGPTGSNPVDENPPDFRSPSKPKPS